MRRSMCRQCVAEFKILLFNRVLSGFLGKYLMQSKSSRPGGRSYLESRGTVWFTAHGVCLLL